MITSLIEKLKKLSSQKKALIREAQIYDAYDITCNSLKTNLQQEKSKNKAMKEELGRPFNVHSWRTLEHQKPPKVEKYKKSRNFRGRNRNY
jgi:hypothetical protein